MPGPMTGPPFKQTPRAKPDDLIIGDFAFTPAPRNKLRQALAQFNKKGAWPIGSRAPLFKLRCNRHKGGVALLHLYRLFV